MRLTKAKKMDRALIFGFFVTFSNKNVLTILIRKEEMLACKE
jgi:hypothetical protein